MAIVINGVDVPQNCANCERKAACKQRIYLEGRPDGCPIMAMPENCLECLRTHFRSGIKCGEWAKLMAILNGQDYDTACPFAWIILSDSEECSGQTDKLQCGD